MYPDKLLRDYQLSHPYPIAAKRPAHTCILGNGKLPPYMKMAHAYVPYQFLRETFRPTEALKKGTIFPDLYQPYIKRRDRRY